MLFTSELNDHLHVCPKCGHHFRVNARQRISLIADEDSFEEHDAGMRSRNLIGFPNYDRKLKHAYLDSAEKEVLPLCDGAVFYDGKYGDCCG